MRNLILMTVLAAFVGLASAQALDTSVVGPIAYIYTGSPINLTIVNSYMGNTSGLYNTILVPFASTNYTDGEVWWVGRMTGYGDCPLLPYLSEDDVGMNVMGISCSNRWGWSGGSSQHEVISGFPGCSGSCYGLRINVRLRADGWIMAYMNRTKATPRAALLRWSQGSVWGQTAAVDDTVLGITLSRTMAFLNSTRAWNLPTYSYARTNVTYYDFEFPNATALMIGGKGLGTGSSPLHRFGFSPLNRTVYHASISAHVQNSVAGYLINNQRFICFGNFYNYLWIGNFNLGNSYITTVATAAPLPACNSSGGWNSGGDPFFAWGVNLTAFPIYPNNYTYVTSEADEFKAAMWVYLG